MDQKKVISKEEDLSEWDVTLNDGLEDEDPIEIPFTEEELNNMATFTKKDVETMVEAIDNPKEPNDALKNAVRPAKHEPVKKVGLTQQVKEARVVKPANITRSTQPDNGLSALVQRTSKTQPGEN